MEGPSFNAENREVSEIEQKIINFLEQAELDLEKNDREICRHNLDTLEKAQAIIKEKGSGGISEETIGRMGDVAACLREIIASGDETAPRSLPRPEADFTIGAGQEVDERYTKTFLESCEKYELESNLLDFDPLERRLVEKFIAGEKVSNLEANQIKSIRKEFWEGKDDGRGNFPDQGARNDYLAEKYGLVDAPKLRARLLNAIASGSDREMEDLRQDYARRFPGQLEAIEAMLSFKNFLSDQKMVDKSEKGARPESEIYLSLTEYRYLMSDLVTRYSADAEFLVNFWNMMRTAAVQAGEPEMAESLIKSTLSQVAVFRAFQELGYEPEFSLPREDAFDAIDIWLSPAEVVQVMGSQEDMEMIADYIAFPSVIGKKDGVKHYVSDYVTAKTGKFVAKASGYAAKIYEDLNGMIVGVPYDKFDQTNGAPNDEFIKFIAEKLRLAKNKEAGSKLPNG